MKFKEYRKTLKPLNWIKGFLMVIFGVLNARIGIGIGRVTINLILGPLTYLFLIASGMLILVVLQLKQNPSVKDSNTIKQVQVLCGIVYIIALVLAICHGIIYNLGIFNILFIGLIGFIWLILGYVALKITHKGIITNLIVSLTFSLGIIYGAILNIILVPIFVLFFFFTSFSLQFSREIVKGCRDIETDENTVLKSIAMTLGADKAQKISVIFQISALIFFLLPLFFNIINVVLYLFPMIAGLIIMVLALIFTLKGKGEKKRFKLISLLLRVGILVELFAFILGSV